MILVLAVSKKKKTQPKTKVWPVESCKSQRMPDRLAAPWQHPAPPRLLRPPKPKLSLLVLFI